MCVCVCVGVNFRHISSIVFLPDVFLWLYSDLRDSDLRELLDTQNTLKSEKKKLQRTLKQFEHEFEESKGKIINFNSGLLFSKQ